MPSVFKLKICKWSQQPGLALSIFSLEIIQSIAVGTMAVHGVLEKLRTGELDEKLPGRPPLQDWLKFYDDHRRVSVEVMKIFPEVMGEGQDGQNSIDAWRKESVAIKNDPEKFKRRLKRMGKLKLLRGIGAGVQFARFGHKKHLGELRLELMGKEKKDKRDLLKLLTDRPEFLWYLRVGLPCVVLYKTFPITLLRKAIRAEKAKRSTAVQAYAIERLVRLDPLMMNHPAIERWWNSAHGPVRLARFKQLATWASEGLNCGKFSACLVKEAMGGLILEIAERFGKHFTWPNMKVYDPQITAEQVRELFYAVTKDRSGSSMGVVDEDLEDLQRGSWRRAITTHKKMWKRMFDAGGGFKSATLESTGS